MPTPSKKKANRKESLSTAFNDFACKAVQDFPALKDKFLVYAAPLGTFFGSWPQNDTTEDLMMEVEGTIDINDDIAYASKDKDSGYYVMAYLRNSRARTMTSTVESRERDIIALMEHELGHLVAPGGDMNRNNNNFSECVADSFSFIRMSHAYTDFERPLEATIWNQAREFIFLPASDSTQHFAVPTLLALRDLARHHDLKALSPVETGNLAYRLALKNGLSAQALKEASDAFAPAAAAYQKTLADGLKACGELLLNYKGPQADLVKTTCRILLAPFLGGNKHILRTSLSAQETAETTAKLTGPFWNKIRATLAASSAAVSAARSPSRLLDEQELLGRFDKAANKPINPRQYERASHRQAIQKKRDALNP